MPITTVYDESSIVQSAERPEQSGNGVALGQQVTGCLPADSFGYSAGEITGLIEWYGCNCSDIPGLFGPDLATGVVVRVAWHDPPVALIECSPGSYVVVLVTRVMSHG